MGAGTLGRLIWEGPSLLSRLQEAEMEGGESLRPCLLKPGLTVLTLHQCSMKHLTVL